MARGIRNSESSKKLVTFYEETKEPGDRRSASRRISQQAIRRKSSILLCNQFDQHIQRYKEKKMDQNAFTKIRQLFIMGGGMTPSGDLYDSRKYIYIYNIPDLAQMMLISHFYQFFLMIFPSRVARRMSSRRVVTQTLETISENSGEHMSPSKKNRSDQRNRQQGGPRLW